LVFIADATDEAHAIGSIHYRTALSLLTLTGPEEFTKLINSPDWVFLPEQWQVQMWARVFKRIPMDHLIFYAPQFGPEWRRGLPGLDAGVFLSPEENSRNNPEVYGTVLCRALEYIARQSGREVEKQHITWISDGPYVIPR
jgi:hypothetical protein